MLDRTLLFRNITSAWCLVAARFAMLWLITLTSATVPCWADEVQEGTQPPSAVPMVGIVPAPPFAMKDNQGNWEGIAVDVWRHAAREANLTYEFREMTVPDIMAGISHGTLLAVVTATASADAEMKVDYSHPYYSSGLAIAVREQAGVGSWFALMDEIFSSQTIRITGVLLGLLMVAAILVWLCERRVNQEHFRPGPLQGIGDALWWAAVTLTTVGYGDKAPRSRAGRFFSVIWMFVAVILIALFTAQVTSSLTVTGLSARIQRPGDLAHVSVGVIQNSQPQSLLRSKLGILAKGYPGIGEGLTALENGEIDAFVSAEPVLRYEVAHKFAGRMVIIGAPFMRADYVFAFPLHSPIRKEINRSILAYIETDDWHDLLHEYLGTD